MKSRLRRALAIACLVSIVLAPPALAEESLNVLARPVPLMFVAVGIPLFLIAAPFSLLGGLDGPRQALEALVLSPARAVIAPLPGGV